MTLTEFLLARIAEDEHDARDYSDDDSPGTWRRWGEDMSAVSRRIVELHSPHDRDTDSCRTCSAYESCGCLTGPPFPCPTLRALAQPYADHPDFREEWKP